MKRIVIVISAALVVAMLVSVSYAKPWRWQGNQNNTFGWQLMTPEERAEHQAKMRSFTEYNACKEYVDDHHKKMEGRAKEKGITPPVMKRNPCDTMKARGILQ